MRDLAVFVIVLVALAVIGVFGASGTEWGQGVIDALVDLAHAIVPGGQ